MRRHRTYLVAAAAVAAAAAWSLGEEAARTHCTATRNYEVAPVIVDGNNRFAFDLYAKLKDEPGNVFISPYSIWTAMAMTYAGARGDTIDEMAAVMHYKEKPAAMNQVTWTLLDDLNRGGDKRPFELSVANALWGAKGEGFLPEFLTTLRERYGAGLTEVDFSKAVEACKAINTWVEKETKGKIKDLVNRDALGRGTVLVLTNAIYFKGTWEHPFEKSRTKDMPFSAGGDKAIDVPMMHQQAHWKYAEDEDTQVLEMGYKGDRLSMVILLPRKADGLAALEKRLTSEHLKSWLDRLSKREVSVWLPRFKMTREYRLRETLVAMGMKKAFTGGEADFSGMNGKRDLAISDVVHKAFVDVNEEGTEAAAATAVIMGRGATMPQPVPVFRADHPFVFMIRDTKTGTILFLGRVRSPNA